MAKEVTAGNLIILKTAQNGHKLFMVNAAEPDGFISAFPIQSIEPKEKDYLTINPDSSNKRPGVCYVSTDVVYKFDNEVEFTKLHGVLTPENVKDIQDSHSKSLRTVTITTTKEQVDDLDELSKQIKGMYSNLKKDPALLLSYMQFASKFYTYSPRNTMLIFMQNHYATFVASEKKYKELGYKVNVNADRIQILRPISSDYFYRDDGTTCLVKKAYSEEKKGIAAGLIEVYSRTSYVPTYVYDISQTDCRKEEYPRVYNMGYVSSEHSKIYDKMLMLCSALNISVVVKDVSSISLNGYYQSAGNRIVISQLLNDSQRLSTLCHELSHAILHSSSNQPEPVKEFEAQCLSNMLLQHYGFVPEYNDVSYVSKNLEEAEETKGFDLKQSVERMHKQLRFVVSRIEIDREPVTVEYLEEIEARQEHNIHTIDREIDNANFQRDV